MTIQLKDKSKGAWFEKWFQEDYVALYPNRDENQAQAQVHSVLQAINIPSHARVIDLGCGSGRHLQVLQKKFPQTIGMDLSSFLLKDSSSRGLSHLVQGDFRFLPFAPESFDLVCSFFSSFGYFETAHEDWSFFGALCSLVKMNGYLFLDLPNGPYAVSHLPPDDTRHLSNGKYTQRRRWDGECIHKTIDIERSHGAHEQFTERLRLFSYSQLEDALRENGLEIVKVFGDEKGSDYERNKLPRMSFLTRRIRSL